MYEFCNLGPQKWHNFSLKLIIILMTLNLVSRCAAERIAVIGGGIGGTASAYFLNEMLDADIDVFENKEVGGRLAVVTIAGQEYEAGGAIIHPRNQYMQILVKQFGLSHRRQQDHGRMGFYNGKEFVFEESRFGIMTFGKLLWRYFFSLITMESATKSKLNEFDNIYKHQRAGKSYATVAQLLDSMSPNFTTSCMTSAHKGFMNAGMSEQLVHELLAATLIINYGQYVDTAHEFVGFVSIAAADGGLWAVENGNYQVPLHLLAASGAGLIKGRVTEVHARDRGYELSWLNSENEEMNTTYDAVIIATPMTKDYKHSITLPPLDNPLPDRHMHRLFVTFVQGVLNYSSFGITKDDGIEDVVQITDKRFFNSVSLANPVDGSEHTPDATPVYKVFSNAPLSTEELDSLFSSQESLVVREWLAYPRYLYAEPLEGSFVLREGLYYLNAIEWAASAMEMSVIAAKNVALLTQQFLRPNEPYVDVTSAANKLEL